LTGFIADTGIATQRDAVKEKEDGQSLKQKTRERVQPKMGKIDIDYQKLHDAFFRFQTKPKMTDFGELCVFSFPPLAFLAPLLVLMSLPSQLLRR
jgi:splicing factor 3B subunit 2